jgi:uncharacterized protein YbjT (DUF2867 family)
MNNTDWTRVYTGTDFTASLLKVEIEDSGVEVKIDSDKQAGLHAGFGSSGFAQVLVHAADLEKVKDLVAAFEEKMK